jgi:hypothetical protein
VEKLLFPVKQGHVITWSAWFFCLGMGPAACGYTPVYGATRPPERLTVVAAPTAVPQANVVHETLAGAREELSRAGVLRPGTGYPRLVIQVLRVDEASSGVAAAAETPLARGSSVGVVGRAWVEPSAGGSRARDSGDLRRIEWISSGPNAADDAVRYNGALRVAARRLGRSLALRILGDPEPALEPM